jgi:hypothetical protein
LGKALSLPFFVDIGYVDSAAVEVVQARQLWSCVGLAAVEVIGAALDVEGGADADEVRMRVGEGRTSAREGAVGTRGAKLGAVKIMGVSGAAVGAVGREGDRAQGERDSVDTKIEALDIAIAVGVDGIEAGMATLGVGMLGTEVAGAEERLGHGCASVEGCERCDVPPQALTSDQQSQRRGRANLLRLYELILLPFRASSNLIII